MLKNQINHPTEQLPMEDVLSPISAQMFDFCDQELFPETLQNSEVSSSISNCCYEENSSHTAHASLSSISSFPSTIGGKFNNYNSNNNNDTSTNTTTNNNSNNLSIIFDSQDENDNDISASIDFSPPLSFSVPQFLMTQQDQFDLSSFQPQIPLTDVINGFSSCSPHVDPIVSLNGPPLLSIREDDCLSPLPSYVHLDPSSPSCSFLDPNNIGSFMQGNLNNGLPGDPSGILAGNILMACSDLQPQELVEFQGDNGAGLYCPDSMQQVYSPGDTQALNNENQQLVNGAGNSPLASELSTLEESAYKVGRLSVEEREEKIHRYMKKRNERNFSKKIKYACRKTLADSRPRVRGRFAKNDEFGETARHGSDNHEDEDDEEVAVKEELDMVDSSDIFAHISGVNSFKCNYPIQSWI